jgi:hypothetical protein
MKAKTVAQRQDDGKMPDMSTLTLDKVISVRVAAERLQIDEALVKRYCQTGRLRATKLPGTRPWIIDAASVEEFAKMPRPVGNPNFSRSSS